MDGNEGQKKDRNEIDAFCQQQKGRKEEDAVGFIVSSFWKSKESEYCAVEKQLIKLDHQIMINDNLKMKQ